MSLTLQIAQWVPSSVLVRLGRLRYTSPMLRPILEWAYRPMLRGESVLCQGVGKGLRFDPVGSNPGYAIGAIALQEQAFLARQLKTGMTFYDIGANVGFFAVLAGKLTGPTGHVYAFEPFHESAQAVKANAARNGFEHVRVFEAAVSRIAGTGHFITQGKSAEFRLDASIQKSDLPSIPVALVAIDDLLNDAQLTPPDVVMIDVEGAEIDVLHGMKQTIARHRPAMVCEVHGHEAEFSATCDELVVPNGYTITRLDDGQELPRERSARFHALMMPIADSR